MSAARRIYTFERIPNGDPQRRASACAVGATISAIAGHLGIHYEELTDKANARPIIAVVFSDVELVESFADRLLQSSIRNGVRVIRHITG
jgi:hypothetical protein